MARPVRIHIPNATYLVQLRARPGEVLFSSEQDRTLFLDSLGQAVAPARVAVYAFALLETSALLFLRSSDMPLSRVVHRAQAGYFNRLRVETGRSQPLLRDRHRAILVEEGDLFREVVRRVHLAPVIGGHWSNESEARKWGEVSTNRWTSFPIYTGRFEAPDWFDRAGVIEEFREFHPKKPEEGFYRYVIMGVKGSDTDILDKVVAMSLLGSEDFVQQYYEGAKGRRRIKNNGTPSHGMDDPEQRFRRIVRCVGEEFDTPVEELTKPRSRHPGRKYVVELALRHALDEGGVKALGEKLHVSGSALAHLRRAFGRSLEQDTAVRDRFTRLEKRVLEG